MSKKGKRKVLDILPSNWDSMSEGEKKVLEEVQYKKQMYSRMYGR